MRYRRKKEDVIKDISLVDWNLVTESDYFYLEQLKLSIRNIDVSERNDVILKFQEKFSKYKFNLVYDFSTGNFKPKKSENDLLFSVIEENNRLKSDIDVLETMCSDLNQKIIRLQNTIRIMESERRGV